MRIASIIMIVPALALAFGGCGKDRTPEDQRRDKVTEYLARIDKVKGTYRGELEGAGGAKLGAVEVALGADSEISATRDTLSTQPQAALKGRVTLHLGGEKRMVSFEGGYYDDRSGAFKAELPIVDRNGATEKVDLSGTIDGDVMNASLEVLGYDESSGSFRGLKNGPLPSSEGLGNGRIGGGLAAAGGRYSGLAKFTDGGASANVGLNLVALSTSLEQDFLDVFTAVKWMNATLVLGETPVPFRNAQWDQRSGLLTGTGEITVGGQLRDQQLRCRALGGAGGWDCEYSTNRRGVILTARFLPVTEPDGREKP